MTSAASLTDSPTSMFWLTVLVAAVGIVAAIVGFATWRSGISRKKLLVTIASRSRMFSAPEPIRDQVKLIHGDQTLINPYVTVIEMLNLGKSPVKSEDFDRERDLVFESNVQIIKVLATEHRPPSAPAPNFAADGNKLSLRPELIAKGEVITSSLLTEGRLERIETILQPLGDVTVEIADREAQVKRRSRRATVAFTAGAVAFVCGLTVAGILISSSITRSDVTSTLTLPTCVLLNQQQLSTSDLLQATVVDFNIARISTSKAVQLSEKLAYQNDANRALLQAKFLVEAYQVTKSSGIGLGSASGLIPRILQSEAILENLEKGNASKVSTNDLSLDPPVK